VPQHTILHMVVLCRRTIGEAPKERVGLQVKRGSFPVSFRPSLREPGDVKASVIVVGNGEWCGVCWIR
jgi:hypothetical protein